MRPSAQTVGVLAALLLCTLPALNARASPRVSGMVRSLQSASLNKGDRALQQKGYYEKLDNRGRLSMQLWSVVGSRPPGLLALDETRAFRPLKKDFLGYELAPLTQAVVIGKTITINRWGMRDRDYTLEKPAGTMRIALTGPSLTMGSGVADDSTYDAFLESELNQHAATGSRFEVLNFGVAAYSILHQTRTLDEKVYRFQPDVVLLADGRQPERSLVEHLGKAVWEGTTGVYPDLDSILAGAGVRDVNRPGIPIPTETLRRAARAVGVEARIPTREIALRLYSVTNEIFDWSFKRIVREARANGAIPVFVDGILPVDTAVTDTPMIRSARAAGVVVIKLSDIWRGQPLTELRLGSWDIHPNGRAMKLIAIGLYREFQRRDAELHLGVGQAVPINRTH
jgi:hypothetical protein